MILKKIKITNFRNYKKLELDLDDHLNIIYGHNGAGKTNILESIYVLALTKSHRTHTDNTMIQNEKENAVIKGMLQKDISYNLEINIKENKKIVKIDNKKESTIAAYIEKMNVIVFSSEDLDLIKGSPKDRRKYINLELSQLSSNYYKVLNDYEKLIKIRNEELKKMNNHEKTDFNYFKILNDYIINKSIFIYQMRNKYIEKLNKIVPKIFEEISGLKKFRLKYIPSVEIEKFEKEKIEEVLKKELTENIEKEVAAKMTLYGPHRDDFEFCIEEDNLKEFGSQGQQKMAIIALKLSEIEIFNDYKNTSPIILLDDVFSDLDSNKRNNLLKHINKNMQVIITTTDLESIDKKLLKKAKLIHIEKGKIIKEEVEE